MCLLYMDKEQRCSRNSFVLKRLKSLKLQHLPHRQTDIHLIMLWLLDTRHV